MKNEILFPALIAGAMLCSFTACSDSGSDNPAQPADSSVEPTSSETVDALSSAVVDPTSSASVDPTASEIVDPASSASVDPLSSATVEADPAIVSSSSAAVVVDPVATYDPDTYDYYGAELSGTDQFKYGRFEARMKMVSIPGSVSSMFLYYDDSYIKGEIPWNEIDIEVIGKSDTSWQSNIITREGDESITKNTSTEKILPFGFSATEDFHLYGIVWTPEYVAWEIDSVEVRRIETGTLNGTHADADQVAFLTETETLRFNLWASASAAWTGKFTGAELANGPQTQWIDYVRVYSYDEATKTFTQDWQDDFSDASLSNHWTTGNWDMERVKLNPNNVVVEDGYCKLLMTREAK